MPKKAKITLNKLTLQIIAMVTMLIDHIGMILLTDRLFLRVIGRLAFPIFAFFVAEGCEKTRDLPRYIRRMALFAVLTEIPFDFAHGALWLPEKQNVLWTFLIAMLCIYVLKKIRSRQGATVGVVLSLLTVAAGFALGELLQAEYGGFGVLSVLVFWGCRDQTWRHSGELFGQGAIYFRTTAIHLLKTGEAVMPIQGLAVFALPLLWLYDGEQGPHSKGIQYACYAFYPVHLLILGLLAHFLQ